MAVAILNHDIKVIKTRIKISHFLAIDFFLKSRIVAFIDVKFIATSLHLAMQFNYSILCLHINTL